MKDITTIIEMIKQLRYVMTKEQQKKSILLFVIILLGAVFETLGVSAIIPFIQSLLSPEELMKKAYIKPVVMIFSINDTNALIYLMGFFIIIVYIIKNIYLSFSTYIQAKFRYGFQKKLSTKMLESYLKRPYSYFVNVNSSEIIRGIGGDVIGVFGIFEYSFRLLAEILTVILIGAFLFYTDFLLAVGILAIAGLCFILVTSGFRLLLKGAGEKQRNAQAMTNKYAYQAINGIKDISVMKRTSFFIKKYDDSYEDMRITDTLVTFLNGCPERIIEAVCISGMIGIVCIRIGMGVDVNKFVPQLAAFAISAFRILPSISRMIGYISGLIYQRPALAAAYFNLKEVNEYEEKLNEYIESHNNSSNLIKEGLVKEIHISNISWKYQNAKKEVLSGLSLNINKGESIALIGASGAGKTTLADIVLGLYKPQRGEIVKDGVDVFSIPDEWAKTIGYVSQSVFLIDDSIRNNIAFGIEKNCIDDDLIWVALEQAQLKNFVQDLPEGLDTIVGERGVKFSGGQRQRIAIARALYYNPDILVLDEATSALDNETETAVMESIEALQGHKTLIIVAHRLSTIRGCDKIYEIKNGKAYLKDKKEILCDNKIYSGEK